MKITIQSYRRPFYSSTNMSFQYLKVWMAGNNTLNIMGLLGPCLILKYWHDFGTLAFWTQPTTNEITLKNQSAASMEQPFWQLFWLSWVMWGKKLVNGVKNFSSMHHFVSNILIQTLNDLHKFHNTRWRIAYFLKNHHIEKYSKATQISTFLHAVCTMII